jgi:hypothetical protein
VVDTLVNMVEQLAAEIDDKVGPGEGAVYMARFANEKLGAERAMWRVLLSIPESRGYDPYADEPASNLIDACAKTIMPMIKAIEAAYPEVDDDDDQEEVRK